jgi:hypothetical protein
MSNRYDDLVLHLKLDDIDISTDTVPDSSNSRLNAKVQGASLVADDTFGACLNLDGQDDYLEVSNLGLPGPNPAHTIEGWIKVEAYLKATSWILHLGAQAPSPHWLLIADRVWVGVPVTPVTPMAPLGEWVHIATSYDGRDLVGYLNGQPVGGPNATTFNLTHKRLTLAKSPIENEKNFQGKIAHVRIYRRALSESEIREDIESDKVALPAFRKGHPIGFSLCDLDENYVLFIGDDPKEEYKLNLELRNTSAQAIRFEEQGDQASIEKHHFELVFRNGVLSDDTLKKLRESKDEIILKTGSWDLYSPGEDSQKGTVSVYFLCKDTSKIFGPGARLVIPLRNLSAAPGSGARGTRIELKLNQLAYVDETTPITGSRIQHLQIISHLGSRRAPLHVGFAGSNRILNDGHSANTLVLQLMNVLRSEQDSSVDVTLTTKSKFLISFDVESGKEVAPWSLCTEGEIKAFSNTPGSIIVAKIDQGGNVFFNPKMRPENDTGRWKVTPEKGQGESPVWSISPRQDIVLKRDGYIQIYLSNIKTSLPSGLTNLYLEYKGIDGFWDGQIVCPIEKAPLLFYDVIGSTVPQALQDQIAELERARQAVEPQRAQWLALGHPAPTPFDKQLADLTAAVNDLTQVAQQLPHKYTGELRVGIGCVKPEAKLEIALAVNDAETKPLVIRKDKDNYLTVLEDGKVGIGNPIPQNRLHIGPGSSSIGADQVNVVVASKSPTAGIAIAQNNGVNVLLQAAGNGGYIGTTSNHNLVLKTNNLDRIVVDANGKSILKGPLSIGGILRIEGGTSTSDTGNYFSFGGNGTFGVDAPGVPNGRFVVLNSGQVGIGTQNPAAKLSIHGGLHVGGDADPGDKNLLVDGKASIEGGLHVGAPLDSGGIQLADSRHSLTVGGSLLIKGSGYFLGGSLFVPNAIEVHPPRGDAPTLTVAGHISERLDVIPINGRGDWGSADHPIKQYFSQRLRGKPVGTMLRAITDYQPSYTAKVQDWRGHWWTGWVDASNQIRVIHNHNNTQQIAPPNPAPGGGGTAVYADR